MFEKGLLSERFGENAAGGAQRTSGYDAMLDKAFPASDVLIFSDMNHGHSNTKFRDLLSPQRLNLLAQDRVTDIYVEELECIQPFIDRLSRGEISKDEFVKLVGAESTSVFLTREEDMQSYADLADVVIAASAMQPPIRIHAKQVSNTPEQEMVLNDLEKKQDAVFDKGLAYISAFSRRLTDSGLNSDEMIKYLYSDGVAMGLASHKVFDVDSAKIRTELSKRLPAEEVEAFMKGYEDLQLEQMALVNRHDALKMQYRIDNDVILADYIAKTKPPESRALIIHGAAHGSSSKENDLDELLAQRGISSMRVNLVYDRSDLISSSRRNPDASEMNYYPGQDKFETEDLNNDGAINGVEPARPKAVIPVT